MSGTIIVFLSICHGPVNKYPESCAFPRFYTRLDLCQELSASSSFNVHRLARANPGAGLGGCTAAVSVKALPSEPDLRRLGGVWAFSAWFISPSEALLPGVETYLVMHISSFLFSHLKILWTTYTRDSTVPTSPRPSVTAQRCYRRLPL